jgi:pimeloyl-ACP methyl ester carboxylesterase
VFGRTGKPSSYRGLTVIVGVVCALALGGCSADAQKAGQAGTPAGASSASATPSPTATAASCLSQLQPKPVIVKGINVQLIGSGGRAVVISNQSGNNLCVWAGLADALRQQGYEVALYEYVGTESDNALDVLDYVRSNGAKQTALLGGSQGAKASIIAATRAKPAPDALVALSAEEFIEGKDVADVVPKLTCPTYYLTAEHDGYGSTSANQNFQKATKPGLSTLEVVPGSHHGVALLQDPGVQDRVLAFLAAHLGG